MSRHPLARLFSRPTAPRAAARPRRLLEKLEDRRLFDAAIAGDADPDAGPQHEPAPEAADTALVSHDGQRPTAEDPDRRRDTAGGMGETTGDDAAARAGTPERAVRTEIVFLDPGLDDADRLLADLNAESDPDRDFEIVLLEGDGLAQIGAYLDGRGGVDAVHILSHGDEGAVRLGDVWLTADNLNAAAGGIAGWGSALTADGDLLIYGCDLAGSAEGVELLNSLATLTGADVAASDDPTGHESRGGDWVLEYRNGEIQARGAISQAAQEDWRHVLAVGPNVALSLPADVPIGQEFTFTATFSNTGAPGETGYGPFVDLLIPTNGTDGVGGATSGANRVDGLTVTAAKYLGADVTLTELVFPDDGGGTGTVFHPYAVDAAGDPLEITGNAGDTLIVLQLPFGSFAPEQPDAVIELTASVSGEADLGEALTVRARGGFQYGEDPLENPASDPSIVSDAQTDATAWGEAAAVAPSLMTLAKVYDGPEDETATGPNHPQTYTISVDVADGQTITDLDVTDLLPGNLQFNRVVSVTGAGGAALGHTIAEAPPTTHPVNGGRVRVNVGSVTGGPGADDVTVVIEFHVPEFDAAGDRIIPLSGEDDGTPSVIENDASALGDWDPADDRDAGGTDNASADPDPTGPEHTLDGKSIAVQKSVANVTDSSNTPGDVLEYTIRFQISDYFTFGDLRLDDLFTDGQRFDLSHGATFSVTDRGGTSAGDFAVGRVGSPEGDADTYSAATHSLKVDENRIDFADNGSENGASDGKTALTFDLSKALSELAGSQHADGILQGGRTVGTDGAATGTITFRTVIQQDFADTFPSGDRSVDHGDVLSNEVDITGVARQNDDHAVLLATETDDSAAGVSIAGGSFTKGIAFINGAAPTAGQTVAPGDRVTYELKYTLPSSDFEELTLTDYLPQPVFDAADPDSDGNAGPAWRFEAGLAGFPPPSGTVTLGAEDTFFHSRPGESDYFDSAAISVEGGNAVQFDFGTYDDPGDTAATIHLVFSVTVSDAPFADGLQLTNIARASESNTTSDATSQDEIVQITLAEPDLKLTKGAVSTDSTTATFSDPVGPPGVTFAGPGNSGPAFTGDVTSADLANQAIDADLSGLDAGDTVKFAVVLENVGGADAYDLVLQDLLPADFVIPAGGLNLEIRDGNGNLLTFTGLDGNDELDLFGSGLEVHDPVSVYLSSDESDELIFMRSRDDFDPATNAEVVGAYDQSASPQASSIESLARRADGELFGADQNKLGLIDRTTGEYNVIGTTFGDATAGGVTVTIDEVNGLSFHPSTQVLYGIHKEASGPELLVKIDVDTGLIVKDGFGAGRDYIELDTAGAGLGEDIDDFTIDGAGTFFATTADRLIRLEINEAAGTSQVFDIGAHGPNVTDMEGLSADKNGRLWGTTGNSNGLEDRLWEIDKLTGAATNPRVIGEGGDFEGLAAYDAAAIGAIDDLAAASAAGDGSNVLVVTYDLTVADSATAGQSDGDLNNRAVLANYAARDNGPDFTAANLEDGSQSATKPFVLAKRIVATSESHTGEVSGTERVTIGEIVRYRLTVEIPEGTHSNFNVTDLLPNGMAFLEDGTATVAFVSDGNLTAAGLAGAQQSGDEATVDGLSPTFQLSDARISSEGGPDRWDAGDDPTFDLGTLTNTDDDADREFVVIEFNAVATNATANDQGTTRNGAFEAVADDVAKVTGNSVAVRIAEPLVTITQTRDKPQADAGDTVTFTLTLTADDAAERSTAFDVRLADALPDGLTNLRNLTVTGAGGVTNAGGAIAGTGDSYTVTADAMAGGSTITVTFQADLKSDVEPTDTIANHGDLTWTSLEGQYGDETAAWAGTAATSSQLRTLDADSQSFSGGDGNARTYSAAPGQFHGERTGEDHNHTDGTNSGVNDHGQRATASLSVPAAVYGKTLFATSDAHTTGSDATIGEAVTYALRVELPEGQTPNLKITDLIPPGLDYESFTLVTTRAASQDEAGAFLLDADFNGTVAAPTAAGGANAGDDVSFDFVPITVNPGDDSGAGNDDAFLLLVHTRVADVGTNDGRVSGAETTLVNTAEFDTDGDGVAEATHGASAKVVEPDLTVTKTMSPATGSEAGDTVTVEFTVQNTGTAAAFDLTVTDDLADGLFEAIAEGTTPAGFTYALAGDVVTYTGAANRSLAVNETATFTFTAKLTQAVGPNQTIENTAAAAYSSRDDAVTVPGETPGDPTGERDATGSGTTSLTTAPPEFSKVLFATDEDGTSLADAAVGETVTYALVVDLPEGTTAGLSLVDLLPDGLRYSGFRLVTTAADSAPDGGSALLTENFDGTRNGSPLVAADFTATGGASDGADVTFSVGEIVLPADNDAAHNRFLLLVDAVVTDRVENEGKLPGRTALVNTATLDIAGDTDANGDAIGPQSSNAVTVTVAEPDLLVTKTATAAATRDGGDTVSYTVTVAHTAASAADARDLVLSDLLTDADLSLVAGTVTTNLGSIVTGNGGSDTTLRVDLSRLEQGQTLTVTFDATLAADAAVGDVVSNTASATFDGLAGAGGRSETETGAETVTLDRPTIEKERVGTSVGSANNAALDEAVVGELVTYRVTVTLPEGTADQATILDSLDPNLEFDAVQSVTFGGDVSSSESSFDPTINGDDLSFDFGTLTNPTTDAGGPQTVELVYTARVKNVAAVQGETPAVLDGTEAKFRWNLNGTNTETAADEAGDVTVIEPRLDVTVTATDAAGDAGDPVVYTITVDHATGANGSQTDAFDVTFNDPLPDELAVTGFSVSHSTLGDISARFKHDAATNALRTKAGESFDLALAEDLTITLETTVAGAAEGGETIAHSPAVAWTSLDGTPAGERTGDGGVNDYAASTAAPTFTVDRPAFVKSLVGTSVTETGNGANDAAIGELMIYRLEVTVPEGTTADAVIADTLDAGLAFVRVLSVEAFSDGAATSDLTSSATDFAPTVTGDGTAAAQVLSFDLGTLTNADRDDAAAETFVIFYETRVLNVASNDGTAASPTSLGSTARLDYTAAGAAQNTADSSPAAVEVVEPVLTIDTEVDDDTPQLGQTVTYTLTLEHAPGSDATAHDLRVTDLLPTGVTLNAGSVQVNGVAVGSAAGVLANDTAGQTVDLTLNELAPGGTTTVTFTAVVTSDPAEIGTEFSDDADLTWTSLDGAGTGERTGAGGVNDYADDDTDPLTIKNPDLSVAIDDGATDVAPGESRTYLVTVTNGNGPHSADATGVEVDLPIPTGVYSFTGTDDAANVTVAGDGTLTWTPTGALQPGETVTLAVTVRANDAQPAGADDVTLTAIVTMDQVEPTPADTVRSDTDALDAAPDLYVLTDDGGATAAPSGSVVYTTTYGNRGPQAATGVIVRQTLPPGTAFDAANSAGWVESAATPGLYELTIGDLAVGAEVDVPFLVTVDPRHPAGRHELTTTATIVDDDANGAEPVPADEADGDTTPLNAVPELSVTIADDVDPAVPNGTVTYTLGYANAGPQGATGTTLTFTPPAGTTFDAANLTNGWTDEGDGTFAFDVGGLAPDGSDDGSVQVTVTVDPTHPAGRHELTAAVSVADDGANGPEADTANNAATEPTTLTAAPDLTVTLSAPTATAGDPLIYTFDYENLGDQGATGVTLTFTPPPGVTIDPAANPLWTDQGDGTWIRPLPDTAAGDDGAVTFTVNVVDPVAAGRETLAATAVIGEDGTNGPDPAPNDTSAIGTALDAAPDLFATIDDARASATTRDVLTYTIAYGNVGDQHSTNAVLTVTPPPHTAVDAATAAVWTDNGDGTWSVSVGDLNAAGASNGTTSFAVKVADTVPATVDDLTATVAIADDGNSGPDANAANDGDSDTDVLSTAPDYFVTTTNVVPAGDAILPGETLTYTLAYGNKPNLQDGTGVVLTHVVPAGTSYDPANDGRGWTFKETNGDGLAVYEKAVGPVSSGAGGTATFSVIVDDTADALREELVAAATIGDDDANGADPVPADNTEPEVTPLAARVDLAVTIDDGDAGLLPGQTLDLTVGYDNLGDQDAADATLTLAPPAGTTVSAADRTFNEARGWVESGGVWTNSLGNLPADDPAGSVLFRVTVDDPVTAGREQIDSAVTIADAGTTEPDLNPANDIAADSDPLTAAPDLTLSITPDRTDVGVGETVTYTLDFANVGDQHAGGTTLTFVVPPGTVGDPGNAGNGWVDQGGGVWTLDLDQVDAGTADSVTFTTTVAGPVIADRETEDATATLADDGAGTPLTGPVTDQGTIPLDITAVPDLVVDTTDHDFDAYAGEILNYTVTVSNVGDQVANGVQVVHTIPEGTTLSADAFAGGWVDRGDGFAVLAIGTVTPGTPATVPFSVLVDSRQPALREQFDATATVADVASPGNPAEADPTPANNVDAEPTPLDAAPDYVVTVTDRLDTAKPGDVVEWTITVRNVGGQDGTGIVLTDRFPSDLLENVRATGGGVVNQGAGTIRWEFDELAGDGGAIVVKVIGTIPGDLASGDHQLTHRASVTDDGANGADPTPGNNAARDVTTVQAASAFVFAYDSFRSAANSGWGGFGAFGGGLGGFGSAAPAGGGGDLYASDSPAKPLGGLLPTRDALWRALPRVPVDPMFSGTAEPGTLLTARVYDADGRLVAERQVMADTAGNWLMSFPGTVFYEQPQKMEFSRTAAVGSTGAGVNEADAQFALRRFFHPVTHATLFFTENPTIGGALGGAAGQRLEAAHRANQNPLGTGTQVRAWNLAAASATAGQA